MAQATAPLLDSTLQSGIALLPVRYAAGMWTPLTVTQ